MRAPHIGRACVIRGCTNTLTWRDRANEKRCEECRRTNRTNRPLRKRKRPFPIEALLPWLPEEAYDGDNGLTEYGWLGKRLHMRYGTPELAAKRKIYHCRAYGCDLWAADEMAVAIGLHPASVWPHWVDEIIRIEEEERARRRARRARAARSVPA